MVEESFGEHGVFRLSDAAGSTPSMQRGVMRTNCIDCLDRTNVVQALLARKALEELLRALLLLPAGQGIGEAFPGVRTTLLLRAPLQSRAPSAVICLAPPLERNTTAAMQLEKRFKVMWADHGDMASTQYAGTGALKSGFTRTGKRTTMGLVDDGLKSAVRYYLNNFEDGQKQDAYDIITAAFRPGHVRLPPLRLRLFLPVCSPVSFALPARC